MVSQFLEFVKNIRFADFIDIGIIATFIYLIMIWFKKARARLMIIGMLILGAIYVLARLFGLYMTTLVFQAFFAIFLIVIIIIFQEDFRQLFERIAIWGMTHSRAKRISFGQEQHIDILCSALASLSRKHIGALMVIRGRDPLDRHLEAGVNLDGLLSQVLLESIFDPHVLSHDGAVVIEGSRIVKFKCLLPLSTDIRRIGSLGARHAAALGLTERTDSLCIVVSEERGTISVAEEGKIKELDNITELHGVIKDFYRKRFPKKERKAIIEFLSGHSLEKVFAIILACSLWFAFGHRTEIIRRDFIISIEYRNLSSDRIIGEPKPKEVTVTLSGSERTFNLLDPKELKLSIDMSGIKDGENKFFLAKDLIRRPSGLSVVDIEPDEIQFKVYRMISINIPIQVKTQGRLPSGVTIRQIKVEPEQIQVLAPSIIPPEKLMITTEVIELKSITETVTLAPKLIISPEIRFSQDKPPEVKVTLEIEKGER